MAASRSDLVGIAFGVVYALVMFGVSRWARWRLLSRARRAAESLTGAGARVLEVKPSPGLWRPAEVLFELDGKRARLQIRHWGRDHLLVSVHVDSPPLPAILIRAERGLDRIGKSLGLSREVQLGDASFDAAAYLVTAAPDEIVHRTMAAPAARDHVRALLAAGCRVELSREGLRASYVQSSFAKFDPTPLPAVMRTLESLVEALPRLDPATLGPGPLRHASIPAIVCVLVAVGGFTCLRLLAGHVHAPLDDMNSLRAMGIGLGGWVLALAGLWGGLRGRAQSHYEFVACAFPLVIGIPAIGALGLFAANSSLDHGPVTTVRARIERLQRHDHEVFVAPWPGKERQKVGVPLRLFPSLEVGHVLEVDTHPGALGWTWVSEVRRVE